MEISTPVVLVPGMWHGSWAWSPVTEHLAARGVPSIAGDLVGHGLKLRTPLSRRERPFDAAAYAAEPTPSAEVTATSAAATLVEQRHFVKEIDAVLGRPTTVVESATSHSPFLSAPGDLAETIARVHHSRG